MKNISEPSTVFRDELIRMFLGEPLSPSPLGYELLTVNNEELSSRVSLALQRPSSDVAALDGVIRQFNPSTAVFLQSHARLLHSLEEWKKCAALYQSEPRSTTLSDVTKLPTWTSIYNQQKSNPCNSVGEVFKQDTPPKLPKSGNGDLQHLTSFHCRLDPMSKYLDAQDSENVRTCDLSKQINYDAIPFRNPCATRLSCPPNSLHKAFYRHQAKVGQNILERNPWEKKVTDERTYYPLLTSTQEVEQNQIKGDDDLHIDAPILRYPLENTFPGSNPSKKNIEHEESEKPLQEENTEAKVVTQGTKGQTDNHHFYLETSTTADLLNHYAIVQINETTPLHRVSSIRKQSSPIPSCPLPPPPPNTSPVFDSEFSESFPFTKYTNALKLVDAVVASLSRSIKEEGNSEAMMQIPYTNFQEKVKDYFDEDFCNRFTFEGMHDEENKDKDGAACTRSDSPKTQKYTLNESSSMKKQEIGHTLNMTYHNKTLEYQDRMDLDADASTQASSRRCSVRTSEGSSYRQSVTSAGTYTDGESKILLTIMQQKYNTLQSVKRILFEALHTTSGDDRSLALHKLYNAGVRSGIEESFPVPMYNSEVDFLAERLRVAVMSLTWNITILAKHLFLIDDVHLITDGTILFTSADELKDANTEKLVDYVLPSDIQELPHVLNHIDHLAAEAHRFLDDQWILDLSDFNGTTQENPGQFLQKYLDQIPREPTVSDLDKIFNMIAKLDLEIVRYSKKSQPRDVESPLRKSLLHMVSGKLRYVT